jgi:hypothetical protein
MILPTLIPTPMDEQRAINRVVIWVAMVRHKLEMREDEVRAWLETQLRARLRSGLTGRTPRAPTEPARCTSPVWLHVMLPSVAGSG